MPAEESRLVRRVVVANDHGYVSGGGAKVAIESALWLRRRGLGVSFVAGSGPMDSRLAEAGIDCVEIASHDVHTDTDRRRAMAKGLWNAASARGLRREVDRHDPATTVIHLHTWSKALTPSVGPVIVGSRAGHVCTLHEYFLACPNGAFYDYRAGAVCHRRALGPDCLRTNCDARHPAHKAWRVARQSLLRSAGRMPGGLREVIHISPRQTDIMSSYFSEQARWHHLPNAVDPAPAERVRAENSSLFLFVGRIAPEKGAVLAARAAKAAGVRIAFVGDGPDREAVAAANPDAEILGWLKAQDVAPWMARARALLFPSLWYEGYPLVVVDAMRMGLPVLVSDATVATSVVRDGSSGLHVRAGDEGAWSDALRRMGSDHDVAAMSEAAYAQGAGLQGYEDYTDSLIAIYDSILRRRATEAGR